MTCPNCRHENRATARFCSRCRARLPRACPECSAEVLPDDTFCDACGAEIAAPPPAVPTSDERPTTNDQRPAQPEDLSSSSVVGRSSFVGSPREAVEEIRVVTVLFADMSRFVETTRDMSPEEGAALVNRLLEVMVEVITTHGGRVDRFLGDGLLAVFGAPLARETDPEHAILAALAIREAARAIGVEVTAGINTGEVYVGGVGSEQHRETTVVGPVVNLAARLQDRAEAGQILVGAATYRQTRGAFAFTDVALAIKGIDAPVPAYRVERPLARPEKLRGIEGLRAPFVGRDGELASLTAAARAVIETGEGRLVAIVGDAGLGKSRLISELKQALGSGLWALKRWITPSGAPSPEPGAVAKPPFLEGRCIAMGQSASFWPFIDLMRAHLALPAEAGEQEAIDALTAAMADLFGDEADAVIPYVGQMLSLRLEERHQERIRYADAQQIRHQTLLKMRDVLVAMARRQPLVLILEDLHWADDLSLDLIAALMEELATAPILLLCAYRPEREHGCRRIDALASRKCPERYMPIRLHPLTRRESEQMIAGMLSVADPLVDMRGAVLQNAEGNPFFVEEVVRLLIERGVLVREAGDWRTRGELGEIAVPDTVKSVILSRVDALSPEEKQLLQYAAVIGRVFRYRLLEQLNDVKANLEARLARLEAHDLVHQERAVPEREYAFKHVLTQETVYEAMLTRHRRGVHRRVGAAIEALYPRQLEEYYELLAFHYGRSDDREKAVTYLELAGQKAAGRYSNQEAFAYFEKGLRLAEGTDAYDRLLAQRGALHNLLYQGEDAARDFELLLERARAGENRARECKALLALAEAHFNIALDAPNSPSPARCVAFYQAGYALARELGDVASLVRALKWAGYLVDFGSFSWEDAEAKLEEAWAWSRGSGDAELLLDCRIAHGELDPELFALLESRHDLRRLKEWYWNLLITQMRSGDYRGAVQSANESIRLAGEIGVPPVQYGTNKAFALLGLGEYGDAWRAVQGEVADEKHRLGTGFQALGIGEFYLAVKALDRVEAPALKAIDLGHQLSRFWMRRWGKILIVNARLYAGRLDDATLAAVNDELNDGGWPLPLELQAEIALAQGKREEAHAHADASIARETNGNRHTRVTAQEVKLRILLRELELGASTSIEPILALADEALRTAEECGYRPLIARLHAGKARAFQHMGDTTAAAHAFQAAAAAIHTMAATIDDPELQRGYLANPSIAAILVASDQRPTTNDQRPMMIDPSHPSHPSDPSEPSDRTADG